MTNSIIVCILVGICAVALTILLLLSVRLQRRRIFKLAHYGAVVLICVGSVLAILAQLGNPLHNAVSPPSTLSPSTSILVGEGTSSTPDNLLDNLLSLQASTGAIRWSVPLGHTFYDKVVGNNIYEVASSLDTDHIVSLNARTGKQQWQFNVTPANLGTDPALPSINVDRIVATNDYVFIVVELYIPNTEAGEITLCSLHTNNGTLVACHHLSTYTSVETKTIPDLFLCGDAVVIYIGPFSPQWSIQTFSSKDLSPLWQQTLDHDSSLAAVGEYIYINNGKTDETSALRPQDGKEVWSTNVGIGTDDTILTGSYMYEYTAVSLIAYDQHNGRSVWQQEVKPDTAGTPVVNRHLETGPGFVTEAGGTVYVLTDDLHLFGYNAMTGHKTASTTLQLPNRPDGNCNIAAGKIAVMGNTLIMSIQYRQTSSIFTSCQRKSFIAAFSVNTGVPYWTYDHNDLYIDNMSMWVL